MKWMIWLIIVLSANCSLPIRPGNFEPWCLNYCSMSNNTVVRATGSIGWPGRHSRTAASAVMDHPAWSPNGAKPSLPGRGSHKRNITAWFILPKCLSFPASAAGQRLWGSVFLRRITTRGSYCFQHSLLNGIVMVWRCFFCHSIGLCCEKYTAIIFYITM